MLHIRLAAPDDAPALTEFARRVFEDTFLADNDPVALGVYVASAFTPERQRIDIEDARCRCLLAFHNDVMVAWALVRDREPLPDDCIMDSAHPVMLHRFYVDHAWHGRGVAVPLMRAVCTAARELGGDALWLTTWERNPRAIRFYEREGFAHVGVTWFRLGEELQRDVVLCLDPRGRA